MSSFLFVPQAHARTVDEIMTIIQSNVLDPLITLLFIVATAFFIWGVIEFIAGASSEEARSKGKKHMIWGIVGLVIMLSVNFIRKVLENFFTSIG